MSVFVDLPFEVEECIANFIKVRFEELSLRPLFPNILLRKDVLDLLDHFCTVVYYPLSDEQDNNGFHVNNFFVESGAQTHLVNNKQHFVFINTAQTIEKQVFTAAHELGHIWEVDDYVIKALNLPNKDTTREQIISRFAAVLLIPEVEFHDFLEAEIEKWGGKDGKISFSNMIKLIVTMVNHFFVPYKSLVLRFYELTIISKEDRDHLLGKGKVNETVIEKMVYDAYAYFDYDSFQRPSSKKHIEGLAGLLEKAEQTGQIPTKIIEKMRETFELKPTKSPNLDSTVSLATQKGSLHNDSE